MRKYTHLLMFSFNTGLLLLLFAFSIFNALPTSPVKGENARVDSMLEFMPQGWGFFSKSPRDESLFAHELNSKRGACHSNIPD